MKFENDEIYSYPISESFTVLYSVTQKKWMVETPDDSFEVDDSSFKEDIFYEEEPLSLKDFHKVQSFILQRIKESA